MSINPLVSVVVPFLNERPFLQETIESVLSQTYPHWEMLLVDDGSTDGSTEIARQYAERLPGKVRFLEHAGHRNLGASAARNLGLRRARGDFIALLDGDDVYLPQKLEMQVPLLQKHPEVGMLYGRTQYWYSWTGGPDGQSRDYVYGDFGVEPNTLLPSPRAIRFLLQDDGVPCTCSVLLRRSVVKKIGGFEECFRYVFTDQAFYAKLALAAPFLVIDGWWERYRQHPQSCCQTVKQIGLAEAAELKYLIWLESLLYERGIQDPEVWAAVRKALRRYRHPAAEPNLPSNWRLSLLQNAQWRASKILRGLARRAAAVTAATTRQASRLGRKAKASPLQSWFGGSRRVAPVSRSWGYDRGLPIDRHYIEGFLGGHTSDIQGRVLEIGDDTYTRRFGGDRVTRRDVLSLESQNPRATFVADLTQAEQVPSNAFDCAIVTQTLHLIYDVRTALATLQRVLKPGGVLLATFPGITRISHTEWAGSWHWGFTSNSAPRLFGEFFPRCQVQSYGNVLSASAFLYGLAVEEMQREELDYRDRDYEVIVGVRAVKQSEESSPELPGMTDDVAQQTVNASRPVR